MRRKEGEWPALDGKAAKAKPFTAERLVSMLATRHSEDIFVTECKDGPTHTADHLRLDAWAMNRSWKHLTFTGYEVKVSRSDFLRDNKLCLYLPLCHMLYLVTPPKLVEPEEVPPEVGLMWASVNGSRFHIRKQASRRQIDIPLNLLLYVLMARTEIKGELRTASATDYWKAWDADRRIDRDLGWRVSKGIREEIRNRVEAADLENKRLHARLEELQGIQDMLSQMGHSLDDIWGARRKVRDMLGVDLEFKLRRGIEMAMEAMKEVRYMLDQKQEKGEEHE